MVKPLVRRPSVTDKIAVGLERLAKRADDLDMTDPESVAAIEFCRRLAAYHGDTAAQREEIRQRTRLLRVSKPGSTISYNGQEKSLKDWCRELDVSYAVVYERMRKGESFEEAIKPGDRRVARYSSAE